MNERRLSPRQPIHLKVCLYHAGFGHFDGNIEDISSGGMHINVADSTAFNHKLSNEKLYVRPVNMDAIFDMQCLRVDKNAISLKFID